jgi:hypothetical protein
LHGRFKDQSELKLIAAEEGLKLIL